MSKCALFILSTAICLAGATGAYAQADTQPASAPEDAAATQPASAASTSQAASASQPQWKP